ncbi:MAG: hypothetical protein J0M08_13770 [Bacteroidetes bacterium]|nr:hypothetical protein [Bacteroidota bacterium]
MALSKNWLTENHIDFEYKKYILLAFLKEVSTDFESQKLYPSLSALIEHYKQLMTIKENKQNLLNSFQQKIQSFDFEKMKIKYEIIVEDDTVMNELESIIDYSLPQFEKYLTEGKKIYDYIENNIQISPVGILPLNIEAGYLLLSDKKKTNVYEYEITIFEQPDEKYRAIHTSYIKSYEVGLTTTYEAIKSELIKESTVMPLSAAFAIESKISELPIEETFLPIAKRSLVKYVSTIS